MEIIGAYGTGLMGGRRSEEAMARKKGGFRASGHRHLPPAVPQPHPPHPDRANAGLHQPLRAVTMSNQAVATVRKQPIVHRGKESFGLYGLRLKPSGPAPQNGCERIVNRVGLTERTMLLLLVTAYPLLQEFRQAFTRLDAPPSPSHHPFSATARRKPARRWFCWRISQKLTKLRRTISVRK